MKISITPLDRLFAKYIKLRDKVCQRCGCYSKNLQASHFHSRRKKSVRWDEDNVCLLCFGDHIYLDGNPIEHTAFMLKRLGQEKFDNLNIRAEWRVRRRDLEMVKIYIQAKLREIIPQ